MMAGLLFFLVMLSTSSTLAAIFTGSLSGSDWLVVLVLYFVGACVGGTMTYHRLLAHRSWVAPKWFEYMGSLCGAYFPVGSPLAWSNNHRAHHRYSDRPGDPHDPRQLTFIIAQLASMFFAVKDFRYSRGNLTKFHMTVHKVYPWWHTFFPGVLWMLTDFHTLLVWYLVPTAFVWNMASLVITMNHLWGYRNYETKDTSVNNLITGYLVFGEGWHNNHHADSKSSYFGRKWWEFDLAGQLITLIEKK